MGNFLYDIACSIAPSLHRAVAGRAEAREGGKEEENEGRRNKEEGKRKKKKGTNEGGRGKMLREDQIWETLGNKLKEGIP